MRFLKISFVLFSICLFVFACTQTENTKTVPASNVNKNVNSAPSIQPTATQDEMAVGKKVFTEKCARCHKEDGTGGKTEIEGKTINAENLTTEKMKKDPDSEYVEAIEKGFPDDGMPAFKGKLTDQEIRDVIAYIRKDFQGK